MVSFNSVTPSKMSYSAGRAAEREGAETACVRPHIAHLLSLRQAGWRRSVGARHGFGILVRERSYEDTECNSADGAGLETMR